MANPEHLAILEQGVEAWNRWYERSGMSLLEAGRPDLRGAELLGVKLPRVKFIGVDLREANLSESNLCEANFAGADLSGANLRRAWLARSVFFARANLGKTLGGSLFPALLRTTTLSSADLRGADLRFANLNGADLSGADLRWADLSHAHVHGTSFYKAEFGMTSLGSLKLSNADGLEESIHRRPSTLGLDTLSWSKGRIPAVFLRGCGLQERLIDYLPSVLTPQVIEFCSAFISYSHTDKPFASRLHDQLQAKGIRCWLDERELKIGEEILPGVLDAIRLHDRVILCCSEASLTSNWVQTELEETFGKEEKGGRSILLPLNLDGYLFDGWKGPLAVEVRKRLAADFTGWETDNAKFEEQFERVVAALRAEEE